MVYSLGSQRYIFLLKKEQVGLSPYEMLYGRPFVYVIPLAKESQYLFAFEWEAPGEKHQQMTWKPGTSAQLAELIALTRALELGKRKRIAIYTDSKYAFLVLHAHAAIWKERGHLTTRGSTIKYGDQILQLLEAVHLPTEVSVSHCK